MNPNTVAQAYGELEREGVVYVQRGRGTFASSGSRPAGEERRALAQGVAKRALLDAFVLELFAHAARTPLARERRAPGWLVRARECLHDRYGEPLVLADLAAEAGVTPVHLARAFRERYGCSMGAYLRAVRVAHVQQALSRGAAGLAAVAADAGFYDQAHMTRVFTRALGLTPGAYRRTLGVA